MKRITLARRQVLRGAGGFTLGLPFLPSIVPVPAYAASVTMARQKRFVSIINHHGGVRDSNRFPADSALVNKQTILPSYDALWGPLKATVSGGNASLSPVLTAPSTELTDRIVGKMNVLRGLDLWWDSEHQQGAHLGDYAQNDGNSGDGQKMTSLGHVPTIDQIMAYSPSFYGDLSGVKLRSVLTGKPPRDGYSWNWSDPENKRGTVQKVPVVSNSLQLFDQLFLPGGGATNTPPPAPARKPIVDRILENYRSLRQSNRRLSADDRQRLDDHVARLAELQRRLTGSPNGGAGPTASCGSLGKPAKDANDVTPTNEDTASTKYGLYVDVVVAGFLCGTTRIGFIGVGEDQFEGYGGSWHQDVAHNAEADANQRLLTEANQRVFRHVFLDLARKLDAAEDVPGASVLDDTLVAWSVESGQVTHWPRSLPLVTAGSAAGFLKTGIYADYQNRTPKGTQIVYGKNFGYVGLTWNQWLATALAAMGVPRSEFERDGKPGYGWTFVGDFWKQALVPGIFENASDVLPFLKA